MSLTALIDGDIIAYQSACVAEKPIQWADGFWTLHSYSATAIQIMDRTLERIVKECEADDFLFTFTCPKEENFRLGVMDTYKHNRKDVRKPMSLGDCVQYCRDNHPVMERPTLEADDILGIVQSSGKIAKGDTIIVSIDKDLLTIPGRHYNMRKRTFCEVSEEEADFMHLSQCMAGDTTDGYSGIPKMGMTGAATALNADPHIVEETVGSTGKVSWKKSTGDYTTWETIVSYYKKAGLGEDEALRTARVARICRASDYDFKNKEVKLWTPQNP